VSMGIDGIVFDFDGLVLDTEAPIYAAWCAAFESFGCPPPTIEQWSVWIGTDTDDSALIEALLAGARRLVDLDAMHEVRRAHRDELLAAEAVRPGVIAWIDEAAAAGIGVAIASSSSDDWVLGHLERLGARGRFDHVVCAGNGRPAKPAPDTYLGACRALGVEPSRALAVEDSPHGVAAAKAAGLACVVVPNPLTESLDLSAADLRLGSLAECSLGDALARIAQQRPPQGELPCHL
jgi:HAD superfamily hydrolase (TIGR01509 family)